MTDQQFFRRVAMLTCFDAVPLVLVYVDPCLCVCTSPLPCHIARSLAWSSALSLACVLVRALLLACEMRLNSFPRLVQVFDVQVV